MNKPESSADLILHRGLFTTLARSQPTATAVAIRDGRFLAVGADSEVMALAGPKTKVVDLRAGASCLASLTTISTSSEAGSISTWSCAGTACADSPMR